MIPPVPRLRPRSPYAAFVEDGEARHVNPRPFLSTAITTTRIPYPLPADIEGLDVPGLRDMVAEAVTASVRAWERATLEAAFTAGIDIRTPWDDPALIRFAARSWAIWSARPLYPLPSMFNLGVP